MSRSFFGKKLSYRDILQLDGAFAVSHFSYDEGPEFNGVTGKAIAEKLASSHLPSKIDSSNASRSLESFKGTECNLNEPDQLLLWKHYWLEYINAFETLTVELPKSIVTCFVGRQAIELGFKYLLLNSGNEPVQTHDLGKLASVFFEKCNPQQDYMNYVQDFCTSYSRCVEGDKVEYFRYPAYRENSFFAGNHLDIAWLSYNFALIVLKQLRYFDSLHC